MDKIDRLLLRAKPKQTVLDTLSKDNPYIGKPFHALLDCLSGDNYRAPDMHTKEWDKYMFALMSAPHTGEDELHD